MTTPRRPLASRQTRWALALARWLARAGVRPNVVSMLSVVFAAAAGSALAVSPDLAGWGRAGALVAAAVAIQLRLVCNLIDGMLAVEGGLKTRTGDIYNEVPDRVADVVILVGAGYAVPHLPYGDTLGWASAVLAVFTAYVRQLAGALGVTQHFIGPMAKQHRMFTLTLACLLAAGEAATMQPARAMWVALVLILGGSVVTAIRRIGRIARELQER